MSHALTQTHQSIHTKMVKQALRAVASETGLSYQVVFRRFIDEDIDCTAWFWTAFYRLLPDPPYHYVTYCHACRHFDLYETEISMLKDDPLYW